MALIDKKLTELTEKSIVSNDVLIHIVDPSDISQSPEGSSFKIKRSNLINQNQPSSLLKFNDTYVSGAQVFDLLGTITQVYLVHVQGAELDETQYNIILPNQVEILYPLVANDIVRIIYGSDSSVSIPPYHTQAESDALFVPKTRTINTKPLSANIVLTTTDIADSINKRYVTDSQLTSINNNTGDNATNTQYSGLATSKEDTVNKVTTMTGNTASNIVFLTAKAIYDWATGLFVPKTRSISINGTSQDLTADIAFTISGGVIPKLKTLTSSNLLTQDVTGFLTYINALSPNLIITSSEVYDFSVTDTSQVFRLYKNGITIGVGQTAIVSTDVLEVEPTFLRDFGVFSFDSFVIANGNLGYINQQSLISSTNGTINYPTLGGNNWVGKRRLANSYYSAATAGSFSQILASAPSMAIGNSNTVAEFWCASEHAVAVSTVRSFSGMKATSASIGNVDPSTLVQIIGIGNDSSDTNMQIMHNDSSGTATKIDLGTSFPAKYNIGTNVYRAEFHNYFGTGNWLVKVENTATGAKTSRLITTDLPAVVNMQLYPFVYMGNGSTASEIRMLMFSWIFKNY